VFDVCLELVVKVVMIGRWSDPWSWLQTILHFSTLCSISMFPKTKSMVVSYRGKVIVPGDRMRSNSLAAIRAIRSSASVSCRWYSAGFHSGWWRLKSPIIVIFPYLCCCELVGINAERLFMRGVFLMLYMLIRSMG